MDVLNKILGKTKKFSFGSNNFFDNSINKILSKNISFDRFSLNANAITQTSPTQQTMRQLAPGITTTSSTARYIGGSSSQSRMISLPTVSHEVTTPQQNVIRQLQQVSRQQTINTSNIPSGIVRDLANLKNQQMTVNQPTGVKAQVISKTSSPQVNSIQGAIQGFIPQTKWENATNFEITPKGQAPTKMGGNITSSEVRSTTGLPIGVVFTKSTPNYIIPAQKSTSVENLRILQKQGLLPKEQTEDKVITDKQFNWIQNKINQTPTSTQPYPAFVNSKGEIITHTKAYYGLPGSPSFENKSQIWKGAVWEQVKGAPWNKNQGVPKTNNTIEKKI